MKVTGRHPEKALTAVTVRAHSKPGRYADGGGLYLVVDKNGAKRWSLRVVSGGRRREIGLGGLKDVSLAEARERAAEYRKIAKAGGDPIAEKRKANSTIPTFRQAAELVHTSHAKGWRNPKHVSQWINTLREYAYPEIGTRRVDEITTPDILKVLSPIWLTKPETARRVRQRIRTVLDWARAAGHREGENPVDGVKRGLPAQTVPVKHHAALPYSEVPAFVHELSDLPASEIVRLAFELMILTATRTSEVIGALHSEVDLERKVWIIPAPRMKSGREHRVPLSSRAAAILARAMQLSADSHFVFASARVDRPISNMAFLALLRRHDLKVTGHGFRSAFRDWAAERTNFPRDVCEMALAHAVSDKTEAAYRRGDLFDKRRQLMNAWAGYVLATPAKVIPLAGAAV